MRRAKFFCFIATYKLTDPVFNVNHVCMNRTTLLKSLFSKITPFSTSKSVFKTTNHNDHSQYNCNALFTVAIFCSNS